MTPDAIAPLCFLAAGLLVVAGVAKLVRPRATAQAMVDAGLPGSDLLARGVGLAEVTAGTWALVAPATGGAVALAVVYLAFAGFLGYVLRTHPDAGSCGCAGAKAVPPSLLHMGLDLVAAGSAIAYALAGGPGAATWLRSLGWGAVPVAAGLGLAGWLAVVVVTEVPTAWRAWVPPAHQEETPHHHGDDHVRADEALAHSGIGPGHPSLWPGLEPEEIAG